jgi:oligoribonuclease
MITHLAWLDLETTGTDEHDDDVIEVGIVITDDKLIEIDAAQWIVAPRTRSIEDAIRQASPTVQEMHEKNGLWKDLINGHGADPVDVEARIVRWFKQTTGSTKHLGLAGSGVAHFDRRFLITQFPALDRRLTYWSLDVGIVRRALWFTGRDDLVPTSGDGATKTHRALDDARQHLDEFRVYAALLQAIPR